MIAIEGQNDYIVYIDENGNPYGGQKIPKGTTLISNIEDVSNDKVEIYTP